MSTEYQQVPSQQAFYSAPRTDLDPWLISATGNMTITWGAKRNKRELLHSPPLYEEDMQWSPPPTPTYRLAKKPILIPASQYVSASSTQDPWVVVQEPEQHDLEGDDSSADDEGQNLYKTELCRSFVESGQCRYGTKCQFAHGKHEMRAVVRHPKYKTEICKTFHNLGTCPYGTRCRFIHTRPKGDFRSFSVPSSPNFVSPSCTPPLISSPISRSPSPPPVVPNKWSTSWPSAPQNKLSLSEEDDSQVPDTPAGDASTKRLAVFRTLC